MPEINTVIVGGGPAGLAASAALTRRGVRHMVLERGEAPGHTWTQLYDSLMLHTGRHLSSLPGLGFPRGTPLFPSRALFASYLRDYATKLALPVRLGCEVSRVTRGDPGEGWWLETTSGHFSAKHLIFATGIVADPVIPTWPGQASFRGQILHSVCYRRPDSFIGRRVLVVGVGNSGAEIASELASAGADVTVSVRNGAHVVPLRLLGIPIQYWSLWIQKLPRALQGLVTGATMKAMRLLRGPPVLPPSVRPLLERPPIIGFKLIEAIRAGRINVRGNVLAFTADGVQFADGTREAFSHVILATGFRAALGALGPLVTRDAHGFARRERVASLDHPRLYFIGHNYGTVGALLNMGHDSHFLADLIARSS